MTRTTYICFYTAVLVVAACSSDSKINLPLAGGDEDASGIKTVEPGINTNESNSKRLDGEGNDASDAGSGSDDDSLDDTDSDTDEDGGEDITDEGSTTDDGSTADDGSPAPTGPLEPAPCTAQSATVNAVIGGSASHTALCEGSIQVTTNDNDIAVVVTRAGVNHLVYLCHEFGADLRETSIPTVLESCVPPANADENGFACNPTGNALLGRQGNDSDTCPVLANLAIPVLKDDVITIWASPDAEDGGGRFVYSQAP